MLSTRSGFDELLPNFPKALLENTFFKFNDNYTNSQLARHTQFQTINKFSDVRSKQIKELFNNVVRSKYYTVKKILEKDLTLLFERATVTDCSGRIHENKTALQLALGAYDNEVFTKDKCSAQPGMVEIIIPRLKELLIKSGKTTDEILQELRNQYLEQFPENYHIQEKAKLIKDKAALDKIIKCISSTNTDDVNQILMLEHKIFDLSREDKPTQLGENLRTITDALINSKPESFDLNFEQLKRLILKHNIIEGNSKKFNYSLLKALYEFRNHFKPKEPLKTGKHFNLKLLVYAGKKYTAKHRRFGGYDSIKNRMHWQMVFGYIQRFVPACVAESIRFGITHITQPRGKDARTGLRNRTPRSLSECSEYDFRPINIFPLEGDIKWVVGYNCAWRMEMLPGPRRWEFNMPTADSLLHLIASKNSIAKELHLTREPMEEKRCVIL